MKRSASGFDRWKQSVLSKREAETLALLQQTLWEIKERVREADNDGEIERRKSRRFFSLEVESRNDARGALYEIANPTACQPALQQLQRGRRQYDLNVKMF